MSSEPAERPAARAAGRPGCHPGGQRPVGGIRHGRRQSSSPSTASASRCSHGEFVGDRRRVRLRQVHAAVRHRPAARPARADHRRQRASSRGSNMVGLTDKQLAAVRWKDLSVVMQSAMNALNPVKSIGAQFKDAMRAHGVTERGPRSPAGRREVLQMVGIDPVHLKSYPHQLSGGMRQRSMIAMAMLFTPDLIIMDEPTSALDVVAQRSLMVQIKELQQQFGFAVIFVTHDMSLVSHFSDRLMVMYAGQVAELGDTRALFDSPLHPYTAGLMEAFPSIRGPRRQLSGIPGSPPDLARPPHGCRFAPRCPQVMARCATDPAGPVPGRRHSTCAACCTTARRGIAGSRRHDAEPPARSSRPPAAPNRGPDQAFQDRQRTVPADAARGRRRRASPSASARSSPWPARAAAARAPSPGCSRRSTSRPAARSTSRASRCRR